MCRSRKKSSLWFAAIVDYGMDLPGLFYSNGRHVIISTTIEYHYVIDNLIGYWGYFETL